MADQTIGIIIALCASLGIGISNVLIKKAYKDFSPAVAFLIFAIFTAIVWTPVALAYGVDINNLLRAFLYGLISATLAQGVWYYVLSKGELSITSTILASYPIYTIIFSLVLLGESFTNLQALFIGLNIFGVLVVSWPQKRISRKDLLNLSYIAWPLIGAMSVGMSDTLSKNVISDLSLGTYLLGLGWAHIPVALVYFVLTKEDFSQFKLIASDIRKYKFAILGALSTSIGSLCIFTSFNYAPASIVAPISASYPVLTVILALIFLKEKLSLKDVIGLVLVFIGIMGVSLAT